MKKLCLKVVLFSSFFAMSNEVLASSRCNQIRNYVQQINALTKQLTQAKKLKSPNAKSIFQQRLALYNQYRAFVNQPENKSARCMGATLSRS